MIQEKDAADWNPDYIVGEKCDNYKRSINTRTFESAYSSDRHRRNHTPPGQWVARTPDGRDDVAGRRKVLPISHRPQHQRPAPPRRRVRMRRRGDAFLVPDYIFVVVEEISDPAPPSECVMRRERGNVKDRGNRAKHERCAGNVAKAPRIRNGCAAFVRGCFRTPESEADKSRNDQKSDRGDVEFRAKAETEHYTEWYKETAAAFQRGRLDDHKE